MISQLAICATKSGVIGVDGKLAVSSRQDMLNFQQFTAGTVLIVGRLTAKEMLQTVKPTAARPVIVVGSQTEAGWESLSHLYMAPDPKTAVAIAGDLVKSSPVLSGFTIAGGVRLYEWVRAKLLHIDRLYVAVADDIEIPVGSSVAALDVPIAVYVDALKKKMSIPMLENRSSSAPVEIPCTVSSGLKVSIEDDSSSFAPALVSHTRPVAITFTWMYDADEVCPEHFYITDKVLWMKLSSGAETYLDAKEVVSFEVLSGRQAVKLNLRNGQAADFRFVNSETIPCFIAALKAHLFK